MFLESRIGGFCALSGVFILTLPIPIVVNSFAQFYKNRLWRNEVEHKKKERIKQIAAEKRTAQKFFLIQVGWLGLEADCVMLAAMVNAAGVSTPRDGPPPIRNPAQGDRWGWATPPQGPPPARTTTDADIVKCILCEQLNRFVNKGGSK